MKIKNILPVISFSILSVAYLNSCGSEVNKEEKSFRTQSVEHEFNRKSSDTKIREVREKEREKTSNQFQNSVAYAPQQGMGGRTGTRPTQPRNGTQTKPNDASATLKMADNTENKQQTNQEKTTVQQEQNIEENSRQERNSSKDFQFLQNNQSRLFGMSTGGNFRQPQASFTRNNPENQPVQINRKEMVYTEQAGLDPELEKELQNVLNEAAEKQKQIIAKYPKVKKQVDAKKLQVFVLCRFVN